MAETPEYVIDMQNLGKLLREFRAAKAVAQESEEAAGVLRRAITEFLQRIDGRLSPALPKDVAPSIEQYLQQAAPGDCLEHGRRFKAEWAGTQERLADAARKANAAQNSLTAEVTRQSAALALGLRASCNKMTEEVVTFLRAFCATETKARELAVQCDAIRAAEVRAASLSVMPDLETRGASILRGEFLPRESAKEKQQGGKK